MRALKVRTMVAGHWKLTRTIWEPSLKLTAWTAAWEVAKELNIDHSMVVGIWSKLERWKNLWADRKSKKLSFWSVFFYSLQQWTIFRLDSDVWRKVDFINIRHMAMTSSVVGPRNSKALAKAKLAPKKVMVTGGLLPVWPTTAFWIPAKPLHLRSMLCKFMRCTKNCWSQHWSTEKDWFFSTTMSDCTSHNQHFKS